MNQTTEAPSLPVETLPEGYVFMRDFPNGRRAAVMPLLTGTGRICLGSTKQWETGYDEAYCYTSVRAAVVALLIWDGSGEPDGWFRHPNSGRRRPDTTVASEKIWF